MEFLDTASDRSKRIVALRFAEYVSGKRPSRPMLTDLLEMWANQGIVLREWKVGPCPQCLRSYFEPRLNIQKHLICPGCGNRITLVARIDIGYRLHRAVGAAIAEGIIPVVLTGRFLQQMTSRGFLWLPGVKYRYGNTKGDIDVVACCDGHLVFCECKDLDGAAPQGVNWKEIVGQFSSTIEVALRCNADFVVFASLVAAYPENVKADFASAVGDRIPFLLLDKQDLELGERRVERDNFRSRLAFYDLLKEPFVDAAIKRVARPEDQRKVEFGVGTFTRGT